MLDAFEKFGKQLLKKKNLHTLLLPRAISKIDVKKPEC